ncbi:MAG: PIN domain-containing protein [Terracidiphilus sp.]
MNAAAVADTHAAIWFLFDDKRLSSAAGDAIEEAAKSRRKILVSSISLVEIVYLTEKGRVPAWTYDVLREVLAKTEQVFAEAPLTAGVVESMRKVPRSQVPDMPDRIVAATALHFGVPVISRDSRILASDLTTIW